MNKLVIFDLDGTVIDTVEDLCDSMNVMLEKYNFSKINVKQMSESIGGATKEIVRLCIGEKISEQLLDECTEYFVKRYIGGRSPKTKPFDGIKEVVFALKKRGYKITALSNKPQVEIEPIRDRLLVPLGFDKIVGLSESVVPKPNPSGALSLINEFGASKQTTYFVGDGETDVMTAINAGVNCVAVLWGNRDREFLASYGAKVFAEQPKDLLELIN